MKIPLTCMICAFADGDPMKSLERAELRDDGRYEFTCKNGHHNVVALQEHKFEILFELACNAIVDGYYRDAVASFAGALERFYEFYVEVVCRKHGVASNIYSEAWSLIKAQSERQLGAYVFVYALHRKSLPEILSNNSVKFRNSVIHKGEIPSQVRTINFGQTVYDLIRRVLAELRADCEKEIGDIITEHVVSVHGELPKAFPQPGTMTLPTALALNRIYEPPQDTFVGWLTHLRERRQKSGW